MTDTRPVREGEEIDLAALNAWLTVHAPELGVIADVSQFGGGFSNLTYLLEGSRGALVLRRPPRGVMRGSAHDMLREFRILTALHARGVAVPRPLAASDDDTLLGAPFYLMERVEGKILREPLVTVPGPEAMRELNESLLDTLVAIHAVDASDPAIAGLGRAEGYVARQVSGWTRRWEAARTDDVPAMERAAHWLDAHQPAQVAAVLIHNDFKFDNVVLDALHPQRVRAVLDWEMATLGDPLLDMGTTLAYWVERGDDPAFRALGLGTTALPGNMSRVELWERYLEKSGRAYAEPHFYYVFGMFKLAVIGQQIYARFRSGHTRDERFARLGEAVRLLAGVAALAIERGTIAPLAAR